MGWPDGSMRASSWSCAEVQAPETCGCCCTAMPDRRPIAVRPARSRRATRFHHASILATGCARGSPPPQHRCAAREAYAALRTSSQIRRSAWVANLRQRTDATLGRLARPPEKLVFIVPFADLKSVAGIISVTAPVGLLLAGSWNNVESLAHYDAHGRVRRASDEVINVRHAQARRKAGRRRSST